MRRSSFDDGLVGCFAWRWLGLEMLGVADGLEIVGFFLVEDSDVFCDEAMKQGGR